MLHIIEPYSELLTVPPPDQLLYRITPTKHFIQSVQEKYLHFRRVDGFSSDIHDSRLMPSDKRISDTIFFENDREHPLSNSYHISRSQTYACCFSLENTDHNWKHFGSNSQEGSVCLVFHFQKLRDFLNTFMVKVTENNGLLIGNTQYHQIFSINYGCIKYEDELSHSEFKQGGPPPIKYSYLKDTRFSDEKEFRITLSPVLPYKYTIDDEEISFGDNLRLSFDYATAWRLGVIKNIIVSEDIDYDFLRSECEGSLIDFSSKPVHL